MDPALQNFYETLYTDACYIGDHTTALQLITTLHMTCEEDVALQKDILIQCKVYNIIKGNCYKLFSCVIVAARGVIITPNSCNSFCN
jgi:hypothetical protein